MKDQNNNDEDYKYVKPKGGTELDGRHPMEMIGRLVLVKKLREIGAIKVAQLVDEIRCGFVHKQFILRVDEVTNEKEQLLEWQINYEYAIFEATDDQWEVLMQNFVQNIKKNPLQEHLLSKN